MRHAVRIAALALVSSSLLALSACGSEGVGLAETDPYHEGAQIFAQSCAGCHTLDIAGTQGSSTNAKDKEITDGPNFNQRRETEANVLYAIRNGGFSNKIMPQNIVTGQEAQEVAKFLAKYAGADAANPRGPAPKTSDAGSDASSEEEEGNSASPAEAETSAPAEGESLTGETTPDGEEVLAPSTATTP